MRDLAAFATLIETYRHHVYAVAVATVIDRALAEDVTQETFLAAYDRRHQLRDPDSLAPWLAAIARNRGRDLLRKRGREVALDLAHEPIASATPSDRLERADLEATIAGTLARLPAHYREVLILHYAHDQPADRIARDLGLSRAATLQRLARGRDLIRRHAAALREYLELRPSRDIAVAVLAILAARTARAAAAPAHPLRRRLAMGAALGAAVVAVTVVDADRAVAGRDAIEMCATTAAPGTDTAAATDTATATAAATDAAAATATDAATASRGPDPAGRRPNAASQAPNAASRTLNIAVDADADAPAHRPARADANTDASRGAVDARRAKRIAAAPPLAQPDFAPGCAPAPPAALPPAPLAPAPDHWETYNAFLENAGMPRPGEGRLELAPWLQVGMGW